MAYKRQVDRLPIVPKDAKEFNVTCHYCIVGCGYKAYTWPTNRQGGTAPNQNKFHVDLGKQQFEILTKYDLIEMLASLTDSAASRPAAV